MELDNYCFNCKLERECKIAHQIDFCKNCKDYLDCSIRYEYCEAGYEIECDNGFVKDYINHDAYWRKRPQQVAKEEK